jgi:hypothetical protein
LKKRVLHIFHRNLLAVKLATHPFSNRYEHLQYLGSH